MAAQRTRRTRRSSERSVETERPPSPLIKSETRHGIVIIVLLTLAAVTLLSVFGVAGVFGQGISDGLGVLFGWQRYLVPIYLAVIGVLLLFPERFHLSRGRWLGFSLFLLASEATLHLVIPLGDSFPDALNGQGGGYLGALISYPLPVMTSTDGRWVAKTR